MNLKATCATTAALAAAAVLAWGAAPVPAQTQPINLVPASRDL